MMSSFARPIEDDEPMPIEQSSPRLTHENALRAPSSAPNAGGPQPSDVPKPAADAIRLLLSRYEMVSDAGLPRVIAVTSAVRGEGVTTISRSLASILATDLDSAVCWVDLSWSAPMPAPDAAKPPAGISEVLRGHRTIDEVAFADPEQPLVTLVPSGDFSPRDQSRLARSPRLEEAIDHLLLRHDHIVLDVGPVLNTSEALFTIRHADTHLLVVRHGATSAQQVRAVATELSTIPSLGVVLNRYRTRTPAFVRNRLGR